MFSRLIPVPASTSLASTTKMTQPEPNYKRHTARYRARRRAADILFEAESRDVDPVAIVEDRVELARDPENGVAPIADYTREIVSGAAEELDDIDDAIARYLSSEWSLERIPAVDRAIMRVAVWEILFNADVPNATALVEVSSLPRNTPMTRQHLISTLCWMTLSRPSLRIAQWTRHLPRNLKNPLRLRKTKATPSSVCAFRGSPKLRPIILRGLAGVLS